MAAWSIGTGDRPMSGSVGAGPSGGDRRLTTGGRLIDRSTTVAFQFDGVDHAGFAGDTLASALLANGVDVVARSIYDDRPRGVVSAGAEEPNALVQVRTATAEEPMLRATQVALVDGLAAWGLPGRGRISGAPDTGRFDRIDRHCEVLVIGAGRAGRAAALEASADGGRVILVDSGPAASAAALPDGDDHLALPYTTALGIYDHGYVVAVQRRPSPTTDGRLWHIRAGRVVIATGAIERPIVFADDDRPGIMLASAAATYIADYGVRPGSRAAIFTTNDSTDAVAEAIASAGIVLETVVDTRHGEAVLATVGDDTGRLAAIVVGGLDGSGPRRRVEVDLLLVSGGWNPNLHLWSQARGTLRFDERLAAFVPDAAFGDVTVVGAAAGTGLPDVHPVWVVPPLDPDAADAWATHYVDLQRDATVAHLRRALDAGLTSIEHVKRYTTIGTAADQGKTSGVVASAIAAAVLGQDVGAIGVPTFRPPYVPVSFGQVAGRERGDLLDPIRTTPVQPWHVATGAVFEDVGQWKRPRYFPRDGETMDDAVRRECAAVRSGVAVMDASTLGKIDVAGPDAAVFLDRICATAIGSLAVGSCRYTVTCRLDGTVFDDGVVSRIEDDRFHLTTTTGNAAGIMDHLEEYLQTEWPNLRVRTTSVSEAWATVAVVGPRSRDVLAALAPDLDVSAVGFPFMTWHDTTIAGTPARIARISFSGELAYEISVATPSGLALWEAVMAAGHAFDITPYGTEALHVLRAEKGYPIIGQETDGTVTPHDLGLGWAVSRRKDFIGRRSLHRPELRRPDRRQLVALLPVDPDARIDEGAQVVAADIDLRRPPVPMLGHVTSAYWSAALGRSFALALIAAGRDRIGTTVRAWMDGRIVEAVVADAIVFDPENRRRDGDPDTPAPSVVAGATVGPMARRSPLAGVALPAGWRELPLECHLDVRADPADGLIMGRLGAAAGVALPRTANTFTTSPDGTRSAIWLGPDEWLVIDTDRSLESGLRDAAGDDAVIVDVSGARTTIEIAGPGARETLEHGCSIDLGRRAFGVGRCAQTVVGRCGVAVLAVADDPVYRLLVRPSLARYLADWLIDARET